MEFSNNLEYKDLIKINTSAEENNRNSSAKYSSQVVNNFFESNPKNIEKMAKNFLEDLGVL